MKREKILKFNLAITIAIVLLLNPGSAKADPATAAFFATWYGALILSASISAASFGLQKLLAPKPKPQDKGKFQGDIQLSNVGEDIPINEIYGGRLADGLGGIRTGLTCVYASPIRKVTTSVPAGGGGGKGFPKAKPGTKDQYFQDYAFLAGIGPLRVLDIKANTDLIYSDYAFDEGFPVGTKYEAESASIPGLTVVSDAALSNGQGVRYSGFTQGIATFTGINRTSNEEAERKIFLVYKDYWTDGNLYFDIGVNGGAYTPVPIVRTGAEVLNAMVVVSLNIGSNTIAIRLPEVSSTLDCIHVGFPVQVPKDCPNRDNPLCDGDYTSGIKDPNYTPPNSSFNNKTLAVSGTLPDPFRQYSLPIKRSSTGTVSVALANDQSIRIYEGNGTQPADALLQAAFSAKYGSAAATPAYRYRCLIVIENFETTKYGVSMPNFTALLQHKTVKSIGAMYAIRAQRAGLSPSDYDFTALNSVPLRGYAIVGKQAPKQEMTILNRIFDVDVIQDTTGIVKGVVPDYSVERTIEAAELDVREMQGSAPIQDNSKLVPVERTVTASENLPAFLDVSYFDAGRPGTIANVHAIRQVTTSSGKENIETGLVMIQAEAQKFANRELQRMWAQKDALKIRTFWSHAKVLPATVIKVGELDGTTYSKMFVKSVQGLIPSVYEIGGVSHELDEVLDRPYETTVPVTVSQKKEMLTRYVPPALVIGTIINLMQFRSSENVPGIYVAACPYSDKFTWTGVTLAWQRDTGWETLTTIPDQATIGQTLTTLGAVPGGWTAGAWDNTNTLDVQLYYGELESLTDAQVLDRNNIMVVGDEVIGFGTATLLDAALKKWRISHLQRRLQTGGLAVTHTITERAVLMNSAVRFVPLDTTEFGKTRNYAFLAGGQTPAESLVTSVTLTAVSKYSVTNVTTDRSYDANATTIDELADVLGTVISDMKL